MLWFNHRKEEMRPDMQIRKTYKAINPTLLFDEVKEFVIRQGLDLDQSKLETYSNPSDSSTFLYRGTLTFKNGNQEALRAHLVGQDRTETKLLIDTQDALFSPEKLKALEDDLDFTLGTYAQQP
jgi:hypothetical protein